MAGLYIHLPFCRSKCAYCDFYSTPHTETMARYTYALIEELKLRIKEIEEPFTTLYLGGGTPSMLPDGMLTWLFDSIDGIIGLNGMTEITIEANPEDITLSRVGFFKSIGINRVSIGIQSFNDGELRAVDRRHSAADSLCALEILSSSGIDFNADLIYGLPGQTLCGWKANVNRLLTFAPPHFSAYLLSYEPGTRLYARRMKGKVSETSEVLAQGMYQHLCNRAIECGYEHYEISNFALPGKKAVHNSLYWHYVPYLGLGAAAHSFDGRNRRFNPNNINTYLKKINSGILPCSTDPETPADRFNDYIITSLRTNDGFDTSLACEIFPCDLTSRFIENVRLLPVGTLTLTDRGMYVIPEKDWLTSDAILRELIID